MITDPPFNVRRVSAKPSFEHDGFTTSDMTKIFHIAADGLKMEDHGIVFFSVVQFLPRMGAL